MRYAISETTRDNFRAWLQGELQRLDFYRPRTGRYEVAAFWRYAEALGAHLEEVSLGRYLRAANPVLPTPDTCRALAKALGRHPLEVLLEAGYVQPSDFD